MKIKTSPQEIWREKSRGEQYNTQPAINLYETVRKNENFYIGNQWEGVKAPDLEKPVLNFLRRVVTYFISMIVSDDVAVSFRRFDGRGEDVTQLMAAEVERVMERVKLKQKNRLGLRYAAVDGKSYAYFWFDDAVETGRLGAGEINMELLSNTRVLFGNPHQGEIQQQPYILIVRRSRLDEIRERAELAGATAEELEQIQPDSGGLGDGEPRDDDMVTSVVKLYKARTTRAVFDRRLGIEVERTWETVWHTEVTDQVVIRKPADTGYRLYPLAAMTWETIKDSYQGQAALTGMIPNQIFVNKMWALAMAHTYKTAFPTTFYDATKIRGLTNEPGGVVEVYGDPNAAIPKTWRGADISGQVLEIVDRTIKYTRDFMGASDAALGNVRRTTPAQLSRCKRPPPHPWSCSEWRSISISRTASG